MMVERYQLRTVLLEAALLGEQFVLPFPPDRNSGRVALVV